MLKIVKKQGKIVRAFRLGDEHPVLSELIAVSKIKKVDECTYEVFSQEAVKAASGHGQLATVGDWIRIDGAGFPYPCKNEWFQQNFRHIEGDDYKQIPKVLSAWTADQPIFPEIEYLIQKKGLVLDKEHPDKYFQAILWGNPEVAAKDAVLVFYSIEYGKDGTIVDADYNFVQKNEFERTYDIATCYEVQ